MKSLVIDRAALTEFFVKLASGRIIEIQEQLRFFEHFDIIYFNPENVSAFHHLLQHNRQQNNLTSFTAIDKEMSQQHLELSKTFFHGTYQELERNPLIVNAMERYGAVSGKGRPDIPSTLEYIFFLASVCQSTGSSLFVWRARVHILRALANVFQLDVETAADVPSARGMILKSFPDVNAEGGLSAFDLTAYLIEEKGDPSASRREGRTADRGNADVFVSYAREDRGFVANLVDALEQRDLVVWWDDAIRPGGKFSDAIERTLHGAKVVLVIWSEASLLSDWVRDEAGVGKDQDKLVAISLDDVKPPLGFRQFQTIGIRRIDDWRESKAFEALMEELRRRCSRD